MKLLDWVHRKFRQNNGEEHKEMSTREPTMDDLHYLPRPSNCRRSLTKGQREIQLRRSFNGLETAIAEGKHFEEEVTDQNSDLFHGFLTIGTFGSGSVTSVPSTPIFSISAENEFQLINDELEKALGPESNDDGWNNLLSGRNSHVSTGSTITLSGKPRESGTFLPLQEYLLGSAIDFPETTVAKKDHRVSLGELFQKTKEDNSGTNHDKGEKRVDKSAVKLMKKLLKGKVHHPPSRSSAPNVGGTDIHSIPSSDKKMHKIRQMFHRKVHPETSTSEMKNNKQASNKGFRHSNGDIIMFPDGSFYEENTLNYTSPHSRQCSSTRADLSICEIGIWTTNAKYVVLEFK